MAFALARGTLLRSWPAGLPQAVMRSRVAAAPIFFHDFVLRQTQSRRTIRKLTSSFLELLSLFLMVIEEMINETPRLSSRILIRNASLSIFCCSVPGACMARLSRGRPSCCWFAVRPRHVLHPRAAAASDAETRISSLIFLPFTCSWPLWLAEEIIKLFNLSSSR